MTGRPDNMVPDVPAYIEELYESLMGWAEKLGVESQYYDRHIEEGGSYEWAQSLRASTAGTLNVIIAVLTARGCMDLGKDLQDRFEAVYAQATGYQERLEALEDQCRIHVEGLVAQYQRSFPEDDGEARLWAQCRGVDRIWTLWGEDGNPLETREHFAEAIDTVFREEQGGKLRARAEMQKTAADLAEHLKLIAAVQTQDAAASAVQGEAASSQHADSTLLGAPESDPHDERVVKWDGKRLYLGRDTQVSRLFWLLFKHFGHPCPYEDVQRAVDEMETSDAFEHSDQAIERARNRVRKAVTKLRAHLREHGLDDRIVITHEGGREDPSYTMSYRPFRRRRASGRDG